MKTILLHVHEDDGFEGRLQAALDLVRATNGHLSCVQVTPFEFVVAGDPFGGNPMLGSLVSMMREQEQAMRKRVEIQLRGEGIRWDWQSFDGSVVQTLIDQARLMDVVIISQPQPPRAKTAAPLPIAADLALHARTPVLVVPKDRPGFNAGGNAMIAWNGSAEAAHALRHLVPLLQRAACVHIVSVSDRAEPAPVPGAAAYLSHYGVKTEVHDWPTKGRSTFATLRDAGTELDASYLLMGAYGHARWREVVLGGVTHDMIRGSEIPLLLVH